MVGGEGSVSADATVMGSFNHDNRTGPYGDDLGGNNGSIDCGEALVDSSTPPAKTPKTPPTDDEAFGYDVREDLSIQLASQHGHTDTVNISLSDPTNGAPVVDFKDLIKAGGWVLKPVVKEEAGGDDLRTVDLRWFIWGGGELETRCVDI
jgi:hypothetical protein